MRLCLKEMIPIAKKRKNGEGTLRLRKDGRWEGRIVVGYNEKSLPITKCVTAKTKTECSTKLEALKEQYGRPTEKIKADMPFGEWIDFWYQTYCKHTLRITTRGDYENRIYNHIIPEIGKIPLNKLSQSDLQQFYAREKTGGRKLYAEKLGKGLSDRTIRAIHANCRTALQRAVQEGLIRTNPAVGCKLPPKKAREMQVLTQNEIIRFLHQAKEEGCYELFLLELGTGMRRGEILALKWSDLDFATGELHIERQVYIIKAEVIISEPKTKASIRTVILPPSLLKTLVAYKETVDSEWMFPSPLDNGRPRNPSSVRKRLQLILERAGCKKVRFHDLRHTFATMALEHGIDIKTLSATIGHVSSATTVNIKNPYEQLNESKQLDFVCIMKRANHKQTCLRLALFNNYLEFCCTILSYSEQRVSSRIGFFNSHSQTVSTFQPCEERFSATRLSRAILVLIFSSQNSVFVFGITKYLQFV